MQVQVEKKQKGFAFEEDEYVFPDAYDWEGLEIPEAFGDMDASGNVEITIDATVSAELEKTGDGADATGEKIVAPKLGEGENGELVLIEGKGDVDPNDPIKEGSPAPVAETSTPAPVEAPVSNEPIVTFDDKQRLVIETDSFKKAWKTAGYYLTPNIGETWIWRRRNKKDPSKFKDGLYGYGFCSEAAWFNHTHNKITDVDLELLKEVSGNKAAYDKVKAQKVDMLLSDHLVNLVFSAQRVLHPKEPSKHTGKHDPKVIKAEIQKWKAEQAKLKEKATLTDPAPKVPGAEVGGGSDGGVIDTIIQTYIDLQPTTWLLRYMLDNYEKLPQAEKERSAKAGVQKKIQELTIAKAMGAPEWMSYLAPGMGTAWDFIIAAQLGYYKHLDSLAPKDLVNLGTRSLRAGLEVNFYKGVVGGVLPGIWSWITDLWDAIKSLGSLVVDIGEFVIELPAHISNAYTSAVGAASWVAENGILIKQFLDEMLSNSQVIPELIGGIKQGFLAMAESAGQSMAEGAVSYISKSYYEQGKSIGNMVGYIIPEILLAVFSGAIGNALKAGLKGLQSVKQAISALKAVKTAGKVLRAAREGLLSLKKFFASFSLFKKSTYAPLKKKFDDIIDMLADFFGFKLDEMADVAKQADDVGKNNVPEVSDVTKRKDDMVKQQQDMDAQTKTKYNEESKKDIESDPDSANDPPDVKESKQKALVLAKGIEAKADKEDVPVAELLARLMPLTSFKGVKSFEAEPLGVPGKYMIWMIGSKVPIGEFENGSGKKDKKSRDANSYKNAPLGEKLGSGGAKDVYALRNESDLAIGKLKEGWVEDVLYDEVEMLVDLSNNGIPTPDIIGITQHGGRPAVIMERFALGSKSIVKTIKGVVTRVGNSDLLNQKSIDDLKKIKAILEKKKIQIDDLQFLIAQDGSIVVADPVSVNFKRDPSKVNLNTIKELIAVAEENLRKL